MSEHKSTGKNRAPNIVVILPDQLRPDFLSCYGADFIETPNIDSLAREGVRYQCAVSPSPVCVPARAALQTGLNGIRNGVIDNLHWLRPDHNEVGQKGWPYLLRESGYRTAAIGKMHFYPWDATEGFDTRIIAEDKRHYHIRDDYAEYLAGRGKEKHHANLLEGYLEHKGAVVSDGADEEQVDMWVGRQAAQYLSDVKTDRPFAMMVGFPSPHCPYAPTANKLSAFQHANVPDPLPPAEHSEEIRRRAAASNQRAWNGVDYSDATVEQFRELRRHYAALVSHVDDAVGLILEALRHRGILDDTIIVFASDHGDFLGDFGLVGKYYFHEPSAHIPLIVRHPDETSSRTVTDLVTLTDLFSTILGFAGITPCDTPDSVTLPPAEGCGAREDAFGVTDKGFMVRTRQWKLSVYGTGETHLFNLETDPHERQNLYSVREYESIRNQLLQRLHGHILQSVADAHFSSRVQDAAYPGTEDFNARGWQRPFPSVFEAQFLNSHVTVNGNSNAEEPKS